MINLIRFIFPAGMFIWSLFSLELPAYIYTSIVILFSIYLFLMDLSKPNPHPDIFRSYDIDVFKKYHLYIRFPLGAKMFSVLLNAFRFSAILWTPWLYWNQCWIPGTLLLLNFILTGNLAMRLDPIYFLTVAVNQGKNQFSYELNKIKSICNSVWGVKAFE